MEKISFEVLINLQRMKIIDLKQAAFFQFRMSIHAGGGKVRMELRVGHSASNTSSNSEVIRQEHRVEER